MTFHIISKWLLYKISSLAGHVCTERPNRQWSAMNFTFHCDQSVNPIFSMEWNLFIGWFRVNISFASLFLVQVCFLLAVDVCVCVCVQEIDFFLFRSIVCFLSINRWDKFNVLAYAIISNQFTIKGSDKAADCNKYFCEISN